MLAKKNQRRSHLERIEIIFEFIEKQTTVFPKSRFNEIGLNPRTAEMWLRIIEYIQNQPRIRLIQTEHNLLVEKVEGKYQALMRKMSVDENVPFEQRLQYLTDYLKSLYTREKFIDVSKNPPKRNEIYDININPKEIVTKMLDVLNIFSKIDPIFNQYAEVLKISYPNHSSDEFFYKLSKFQKDVLLDKTFQIKLEQVLRREFYTPRLEEIVKEIPNFIEQLNRAKHTIQNYYSFLHEKIADWFFSNDGI